MPDSTLLPAHCTYLDKVCKYEFFHFLENLLCPLELLRSTRTFVGKNFAKFPPVHGLVGKMGKRFSKKWADIAAPD